IISLVEGSGPRPAVLLPNAPRQARRSIRQPPTPESLRGQFRSWSEPPAANSEWISRLVPVASEPGLSRQVASIVAIRLALGRSTPNPVSIQLFSRFALRSQHLPRGQGILQLPRRLVLRLTCICVLLQPAAVVGT